MSISQTTKTSAMAGNLAALTSLTLELRKNPSALPELAPIYKEHLRTPIKGHYDLMRGILSLKAIATAANSWHETAPSAQSLKVLTTLWPVIWSTIEYMLDPPNYATTAFKTHRFLTNNAPLSGYSVSSDLLLILSTAPTPKPDAWLTHMHATPGLLVALATAWKAPDAPAHHRDDVAIVLDKLTQHMPPSNVATPAARALLLKTAGGPDALASLFLSRATIGGGDVADPEYRGALFPHLSLLMTFGTINTPTFHALRKQNWVLSMTALLCQLSLLPATTLYRDAHWLWLTLENIRHALSCVYDRTGYKASMEAGLVGGLTRVGIVMADVPVVSMLVVMLFRETLPRYLVFATLLPVVGEALEEQRQALMVVGGGGGAGGLAETTRAALEYRRKAEGRVRLWKRRDEILPVIETRCFGPGCSAIVSEDSKLGVCKRCLIPRYCTKSCQSWHWKHGHRAVCQLVQPETESQDEPLHFRDYTFAFQVAQLELIAERALFTQLKEECIAASQYAQPQSQSQSPVRVQVHLDYDVHVGEGTGLRVSVLRDLEREVYDEYCETIEAMERGNGGTRFMVYSIKFPGGVVRSAVLPVPDM